MKKTIGKLFFEFVVIVIGVLTAFGLQEYSQSIEEDKQKAKYLAQIKLELIENSQKIKISITRSQRQDSVTDVLITYLVEKVKLADTTDLFETFMTYGYLSFKLGSYEALKGSNSYDKIQRIQLTSKLNNLIAQVDATLEYQAKIEDLMAELFLLRNNDLVDPKTYKPISQKIYSAAFVNSIKHIQVYRNALTREFRVISSEIDKAIEEIDIELGVQLLER